MNKVIDYWNSTTRANHYAQEIKNNHFLLLVLVLGIVNMGIFTYPNHLSIFQKIELSYLKMLMYV
jgi:hypothetical protein